MRGRDDRHRWYDSVRVGVVEIFESFSYHTKRVLASVIPDAAFVRLYYAMHLGHWPDVRTPKTFSEKIQWLKLNYRPQVLHDLVDKWAVRKYVRDRLGPEILVPVYGVYRSVEEIDFLQLPNQFVMKPTHGSGWVIMCLDKERFDWPLAKRKLRTWLRRDYYYHAREWVYKGLEPKIICEQLIAGNEGGIPNDYKVFCLGGKPRLIQVDIDRFGQHKRNIYDVEWNRVPLEILYPQAEIDVPRPACLDEMLEAAARLAEPFPLCRVDLYVVDDRFFFGELTFFPGNGVERFRPECYDRKLGEELVLPGDKEARALESL